MKAKHTQGEWKADKSIAYTYIRIEGGGFVAMIDNLDSSATVQKEHEANAKLIATAPELLQVLKDILHTGVAYNMEKIQNAINKTK